MKIVIAGSRRLPRGQAPRILIRCLAALPEDTAVMLRRGIRTRPGPFETDVELLAEILHLDVEWCVPEPTDETPGRAATYVRDIDMIERSDLVLLFFTPGDAEAGESGTMHLQDKALAADRPVYAYSVDPAGRVSRIGEHDPWEMYTGMVPAP